MLQTLRKARRELAYGKAVYGVLKTLKPLQPDSPITVPDEFEQAVAQHADRPAFIFDGEILTYAVPLFIWIQPSASTTGTFKFRKVALAR